MSMNIFAVNGDFLQQGLYTRGALRVFLSQAVLLEQKIRNPCPHFPCAFPHNRTAKGRFRFIKSGISFGLFGLPCALIHSNGNHTHFSCTKQSIYRSYAIIFRKKRFRFKSDGLSYKKHPAGQRTLFGGMCNFPFGRFFPFGDGTYSSPSVLSASVIGTVTFSA